MSVTQIGAPELKARLDAGEALRLVDVRTAGEYELAHLPDAPLLDDDLHEELLALDKETPLVFVCHHGIRSQSAATHFVRLGFTRVFNLRGGIDAWSVEVDPSVPRY
jgi:monothiol glutaredoxin